MNKLFFIGTGASMGIPVIGCKCEVCQSTSPFNKRFRPSALLKINGKEILIDAGPDFREQALKYSIDHIDGLILTHAHHDHTAGIDDLRIYYLMSKQSIPCLLSTETAQEIRRRFHYMFEVQPTEIQLIPRMTLCEFSGESGIVDFLGVTTQYFSYKQLGMLVTGYRWGTMAYVTDIKDYSDEIFEQLKGVKILILSALRFTHSHMHFSIDEAVDFAKTGRSRANLADAYRARFRLRKNHSLFTLYGKISLRRTRNNILDEQVRSSIFSLNSVCSVISVVVKLG